MIYLNKKTKMSRDKLGYKKSVLNGHKQFEKPTHTWKEVSTCMTPNREDLRNALIKTKQR